MHMPFQLVHYSQQDPQWKNDRLGFGDASETLGFVGCALTCVAMVASGHGYPETPKNLNQKLKARNGFVGAAIMWAKLSEIHPQIQTKSMVLCYDTDAPLAQIDAAIAAGQPVIVQVDQSPAAGLQTHWVVLYKKQGDDYLMLDPWPHPTESGKNVPLLPRYSHGKALKRAITVVVMYECLTAGGGTIPVTPPIAEPAQPEPGPVKTGDLIRVIADAPAGLRLRSAPNTHSATLAIEPPLAQFEIIEPGGAARVGQPNQWVRVRDAQGLEGYVAAWFVEKAPAPAPAPGPAPAGPATPPAGPAPQPPAPATPEPASQKLTLTVSLAVGTSGLRLRKAPSMGGALVAVEKAGTRLTVLEPAQAAWAKVGDGQWIHVRDPKGRRGYVLGQYVTL
jgi:hypothetical protein